MSTARRSFNSSPSSSVSTTASRSSSASSPDSSVSSPVGGTLSVESSNDRRTASPQNDGGNYRRRTGWSCNLLLVMAATAVAMLGAITNVRISTGNAIVIVIGDEESAPPPIVDATMRRQTQRVKNSPKHVLHLWTQYQNETQTQGDSSSLRQGRLENQIRLRMSKRSKILYLLQFGDSHFCKLALLNGEYANGVNNCLVQRNLKCCGGVDSREAQKAYYEKTPYSFVTAQSEMYEYMDQKRYHYSVLLQQSQMRYLNEYKELYKWLTMRHPTYNRGYLPETAANLNAWMQTQADNVNFRMICGSRCLEVPKFRISSKELDYTLRRLQKFDAILFVEDLDNSVQRYAKDVGWTELSADHFSNEEDEKEIFKGNVLSMKNWDPHMTSLDDVVYSYAKHIAEGSGEKRKLKDILPKDEYQALSSYYKLEQEGQHKHCVTPCCLTECLISYL